MLARAAAHGLGCGVWPGLLALVRQPDCPQRHQHPEPAGDRGYAGEDRRLWAVQAGTVREGKEAKETGVGDKENEGDGVNRDATASKQFEMAESDRDAMSDGLRNCLFHAPEVILAGENTGFGTRADVFSFGCVLWCLATLAPPWEEVQDLYEGLPDYVRFVNTMREVADRVTSGDRLPAPASHVILVRLVERIDSRWRRPGHRERE